VHGSQLIREAEIEDVIGKPFVELRKIFRDDESVVPDVMPIPDCEGIALAPFFPQKNWKN